MTRPAPWEQRHRALSALRDRPIYASPLMKLGTLISRFAVESDLDHEPVERRLQIAPSDLLFEALAHVGDRLRLLDHRQNHRAKTSRKWLARWERRIVGELERRLHLPPEYN